MLLLVLTASACENQQQPEATPTPTPATPARTVSSDPSAAPDDPEADDQSRCDESTRFVCIWQTSGGSHERVPLGVMYVGSPRDDTFVVWDRGGPGIALPRSTHDLDGLVPTQLRQRNLFIFAERWEMEPPDEACLELLIDPSATCRIDRYVTSDSDIRSAIEAAQQTTSKTLDGAYLDSFGSTRSALLLVEQFPELRWLVLDSPAPFPGDTFERLLQARREALLSLLKDSCATSADCRGALSESLVHLASQRDAVVSGRDLVLGLASAATLPSQNADFIAEVAREVAAGRISSETATRLRLLSGAYRGVTQGGLVSPSTVGLWADTCSRLAGWSEVARDPDPIIGALSETYAGCANADPGVRQPPRSLWCGSVRTLLVVSKTDAVVPPDIQDEWGSSSCPDVTRISATEHFHKEPATIRQISKWIELADS